MTAAMTRVVPNDTKGFGDRLKWARTMYQRELGKDELRQEDIADELGVSRNRITQLEAGDGLPDRKKWITLASLLSVNVQWLIYNIGTPGEGAMTDLDNLIINKYRRLPLEKRKVAADVIEALLAGEPAGGPDANPQRRARK